MRTTVAVEDLSGQVLEDDVLARLLTFPNVIVTAHQAFLTRKALVSDFDGTMTRRDFYQLVTERLLPPGTPDSWGEYRVGRSGGVPSAGEKAHRLVGERTADHLAAEGARLDGPRACPPNAHGRIVRSVVPGMRSPPASGRELDG